MRIAAVVAATVLIGSVRADTEIEILSGQEQIAWVKIKTFEARKIQAKVKQMLDKAQIEAAVIKITCLDDKDRQIGASVIGITSRTGPMIQAHKTGNTEARSP